MFSAPKTPTQKAPRKPGTARDVTAVTIITSGCHFSGKLYCRGASRIGGRLDGQIVSEGQLIVEEEAIVTAEIKAHDVIIQGRVQGKLVATGRVELTPSSLYEGDITTPVLVIREGAQFNGQTTMMRREDSQKTSHAVPANVKGIKDATNRLPDIVGDVSADAPAIKAPEIHVANG